MVRPGPDQLGICVFYSMCRTRQRIAYETPVPRMERV